MHNLLVLHLKFFLLGSGAWLAGHLGHVEDFKHCEKVEMFHIQTFKDDLCYHKVNILLLKLNLLEESKKGLLGDSSLPVSFGS